MAKLGDYIEQIRGVSYKPTDLHDSLDEESVTLLRANNIQDGHIAMDEVVYVAKDKVATKQCLKKGDILICTSSGSKELVGKAAYIEENMPMTFGAFCKVIRPKTECPKYIGHFFQSPYYRRCISDLSAGANINNIRNEHIEGLEIPLPPLDEQRRIAAVLDKVSGLIAKRREQLDKLDKLVKARFTELSQKRNCIPVRMGEVATYINGYAFKPIDWKTNGKPIIRIQNLNDPKAKYNFYNGEIDKKYAVHTGDVLVSWATHLEAYIWKGGDAWLNQHIFKVVFDKIEINKTYFVYATEDALRQAFRNAHGFKPTMEHIKRSDFENAIVLLPEIKIQREFAAFVEKNDKSKLTIHQSLDKLEVLKKVLMQQYFG